MEPTFYQFSVTVQNTETGEVRTLGAIDTYQGDAEYRCLVHAFREWGWHRTKLLTSRNVTLMDEFFGEEAA